jgi:hypothetical protein
MASTLFGDLPLDLRNSSAVKCVIGELSKVCTTGLAHVINWFIASRTDCLRSSGFFPFIPRSSAAQMWAQFSPSST